ncbi:alpha/beta hydrolase family protein [Halosimplex marinum]|uniref:alpha/beta hydrolase family protein n=1 Tax=Halosimplex marinum TaxID=3396620 RepID=UPI003F54B248
MTHGLSLRELRSLPATNNSVASHEPESGEVTVAFHSHADDTRLRTLSLIRDGNRANPDVGPRSPFETDRDIDRARFPAWGPTGVEGGAWSEGELFVHYSRADERADDIYAVDGDSLRPVVVQRGSCRITHVNGEGLLFACESDDGSELYWYEGATGETTRLVSTERPLLGAKASPDGEFVAYTLSPPDSHPKEESSVYLTATAAPGSRRELETAKDAAGVRDWIAVDGTDRLLISDSVVDSEGVGIVDLPDGWRNGDGPLPGERTWIGSDDHEERALQFDGPDRVLGERVTHGAGLVPVVYDDIDADPSVVAVGGGGGVADFAGEGYGASLGADRYLVERRTPTTKTRLYEYDHASGEYTRLFDRGETDTDGLVEPTHESFAVSTDGDEPTYVEGDTDLPRVGGLLYDPDGEADGAESETPPVLWIDDSPDHRTRLEFDTGTQYLAGQGLTVFRVNQRGSSGYLGADQPDLHGGFGRDDQVDIAAAAEWLADREGVDADQVVVFGRFYGGYSVFVQLRNYPDRYAGGVAWDGISDLMFDDDGEDTEIDDDGEDTEIDDDGEDTEIDDDDEAAEVSDRIEHRVSDLLGDNDTRAVRRERSPRPGWTDVDVPLAVLCTPGNGRVPAEQSRELYETLVDGDGRVEYVELPDGRSGAAYDYLSRFVDWRS